MASRAPMYEFDIAACDACGETATQNKLIADAWSQFYKCMDLCGHSPNKLQLLISSMNSVDHELQKMGAESSSKAAHDLHSYFGCVVPDQSETHYPQRP